MNQKVHNLPSLTQLDKPTIVDPGQLYDMNQHENYRDFYKAQAHKQIKLPPIEPNMMKEFIHQCDTRSALFNAYQPIGMLSPTMEPIGYMLLSHSSKPQSSQIAFPVNALDWLDRDILCHFIDSIVHQHSAGPWFKRFGDEFFFSFKHHNTLIIIQNRPTYNGFPLVMMKFSLSESEKLHAFIERFIKSIDFPVQSFNIEQMQRGIKPETLYNLHRRFTDALQAVVKSGLTELGVAIEQWNTNLGNKSNS